MNTHTGKFTYLKGNSYGIGKQQALEYYESAHVKEIFFRKHSDSTKAYLEIRSQIEEYCPGLNEELEGFAEGFGYKPNQLKFYDDAWLIPGGCSLGAILPQKMSDGKTYVLRNYDLSPDIGSIYELLIAILTILATILFGVATHFISIQVVVIIGVFVMLLITIVLCAFNLLPSKAKLYSAQSLDSKEI
ncbi:hypothetical protein COL91_13880 [Bacillus pseudomycoides]|nr:hypothetical protein COO02_18045 [Bacillus pseudomycoides]PGA90585.1 hypothetical protein COL91_13880 [Bacillus pseudomycoides]PHF35140.1 hypothetical protein COF72_26785 [Bacillus pseudomycoides]